MIELYPDDSSSIPMGEPYARSGNLFGRFVMPVTSRLRAYYALKGISKLGSHLDIGCGDCLFLKLSPCERRVGLDIRFGDHVKDSLEFSDNSFDNVSMLAVIEHMQEPEVLIRDIYRVLSPKGRLIITTPKRKAEWLIKFYSKDVGDNVIAGHVAYYDKQSLHKLTSKFFRLLIYKTFIFNLNQLFVFEKINTGS